ncbi:AAA-like domain protein [Methyloligella halotolerans]|uniref:AAA-like domain protein n=1 Tax=Methyloligella halotolerans TaxID=1177755 RepID=A0A1E2RXD5_9HYPH|nr:helicase HerA-like domain-containing protein [Methyloligella halotolerans]ODA66884.1 AAA-like domain protein [Methyloligella halotolerans]
MPEELKDQTLPEASVYIGQSVKPEFIYLRLANRHGLITGATGTGKTVTLQDLAEGFSSAGVPVFCADVKGDLSGIAMKGEPKKGFEKRAEEIGYDLDYEAFPAVFWDLFQEQGVPIRSTITELGPLLLSRLMDLSDAQEGVLNIAFRIADDEGLPLLNLADLRDLLADLGNRGAEIKTSYGNVSKASIGAIQRSLLVLEQQGAENFFGEPALEVGDLMRTDSEGRGYVNVLAADKLMQSPRLYGTFLLFLLSELFEELPEVGDPDKPKLVFFFDEAHLLFDDAPKALLDKVEQVVRLIRSKGVGVYFVTQNPLDVPDTVSSQLGNRAQHALRAYTPREQKAVKAAASTFRPNPDFDTEKAITQLGVGEALVSTLDEKGQPTMVERTLVRPPRSRVGPVTPKERTDIIAESPMMEKYEKTVDRRSASEILAERMEERPSTKEDAAKNSKGRGSDESKAEPAENKDDEPGVLLGWAYWLFGLDRKGKRLTGWQKSVRGFARDTVVDAGEAVGRSVGGTSGAQLGRSVARGLMGNLLR